MYENLNDEELAAKLVEVLDLSSDSALKAVQSEDPDLGREWAISILRNGDEHQASQERLTEHRQALQRL